MRRHSRVLATLAVALVTSLPSIAAAAPCPPGYVGDGGVDPCTPCTPGRYQPQAGQATCIDCELGHYQPNSASIACLLCTPGTYAGVTASIACMRCAPGTTSGLGASSCTPIQDMAVVADMAIAVDMAMATDMAIPVDAAMAKDLSAPADAGAGAADMSAMGNEGGCHCDLARGRAGRGGGWLIVVIVGIVAATRWRVRGSASRMRLLGLVLPLFASACGHAPATSIASPARGTPGATLLHRTGDRAAFVLLVNPRRWVEAQAARERFTDFLHQRMGESRSDRWAARLDGLRAPDVWSAFLQLLALPASEMPASFDPARPFGLGLFEADSLPLGEVGKALLVGKNEEFVPLMRHRLLVPARDPAALADTLAGLFAKAGHAAVPDRPRAFRRGDHAFAILAEEGFVRIELVVGRVSPEVAPAEEIPDWLKKPGDSRAPAPPPPPPPPQVTLRWLDVLARPPSTAPLPDTAALRFATESDDLLVLHVRPHRFVDAARVDGAKHAADAVAMVDASVRTTIALKATAEIASGALLLGPRDPTAGDVAFALSSRRFAAVVSLTAGGHKKWEAAAAVGRMPSFAPIPAALRARLRFALAPFLDDTSAASSTKPAQLDLKKLRDQIDMRRECGWMCMVAPAFGDPLGQLAPLLAGVPHASEVSGLSMIVLPDDPRGRVAATVRLPASVDARGLVASLLGRRPEVSVEVTPAPPAQLLSLGVHVAPKDVFRDAPDDDLPAGTLADVELPALGSAPVEGDARDPLRMLRPAHGRIRLTPSAIVAELRTEEPAGPPAPFSLAPPGALAAGAPAGPGTACLLDAIRTIRAGFDAVVGLDAADKMTIVRATMDEARPHLACAAADPATRDEARALDELLARTPAALEEQAKAP